MIDKITNKYVIHVAKKHGLYKTEINNRILKFKKLICECDYEVIVSIMYDGLSKHISASQRNNKIYLNKACFLRYVLYNEEYFVYALRFLIGHESGHFNDYNLKNSHIYHEIKFINWTIEVYNDFYSIFIKLNRDKDLGMSAINYIINEKTFYSKSLKDSKTHPSWSRRLNYIKEYNFNKDLLKKIALDSGLIRSSDEKHKLIDEIYSFYGEIHLQ